MDLTNNKYLMLDFDTLLGPNPISFISYLKIKNVWSMPNLVGIISSLEMIENITRSKINPKRKTDHRLLRHGTMPLTVYSTDTYFECRVLFHQCLSPHSLFVCLFELNVAFKHLWSYRDGAFL